MNSLIMYIKKSLVSQKNTRFANNLKTKKTSKKNTQPLACLLEIRTENTNININLQSDKCSHLCCGHHNVSTVVTFFRHLSIKVTFKKFLIESFVQSIEVNWSQSAAHLEILFYSYLVLLNLAQPVSKQPKSVLPVPELELLITISPNSQINTLIHQAIFNPELRTLSLEHNVLSCLLLSSHLTATSFLTTADALLSFLYFFSFLY